MTRRMTASVFMLWLPIVLAMGIGGTVRFAYRMRHKPPGLLEVEALRDLMADGRFQEALDECKSFQRLQKDDPYAPEVLYIWWVAAGKLGDVEGCDHVRNIFITRYSDHPLAANMYLSMAIGELMRGNYRIADQQLREIEARFPNSDVANRAKLARHNIGMVLNTE